MRGFVGLLLSAGLLFSAQAFSNENLYQAAFKSYKAQDFEKATKLYGKLIREKGSYRTAFYEIAQSYYSLQKLDRAKAYFKRSLKYKKMVPQSLFYISYIDYLKGEFKDARAGFIRLTMLYKDSKDQDKKSIRQSAFYYTGLTYKEEYQNYRKDTEKYSKTVMRSNESLKKAYDLAPNTVTGKLAEKELEQLSLVKMGIQARKTFFLRVTLKNFYDTNVTNEANEADVKSSDKDSPGGNFSLFGMWVLGEKGAWQWRPGILASTTKYYSDAKEVYTNDAISFNPRLSLSKQGGSAASQSTLSFDYDFSYSMMDNRKDHTYVFASRTHSFTPSYSKHFFEIGPSTFAASMSFDTQDSPAQSAIKPGVTLAQYWKISDTKNLNFTLGYETALARGDSYDSRTPSLGMRYASRVDKKNDFIIGLNLSWPDYYKTTDTRGKERLLSVSPSWNRFIGDNWLFTGSYTFTDNDSPRSSTGYDYTKHEFAFEFAYNL